MGSGISARSGLLPADAVSSRGADIRTPPGRTEMSRTYAVLQSLLLAAFAAVYFLDSGSRLVPSSERVEIVGLALCATGLLLMVAAFRALGGAIQIAPEPRADARLVTHGVYRSLRHPIYTAIVAVTLGLFLRKPTVLIGCTTAVVVVFLLIKSKYEEQRLLARYPEYAAYRARTSGVLPWFRRAS
jgi:protein-S-isoprenylcysteine O-methyltransferase Ste14